MSPSEFPPPPPGSAQHTPLPAAPPPPIQINAGTLPGVIDASGNLVTRLGSLTPAHAQTAAVLVLTIFVCALLGYVMWANGHGQAETLALVIRSMESESEKNRNTTAAEFQRNREAFAAESKSNRDAIADGVKLTVASHQRLSVELGKLEQVVAGLSSSLNELKRKIPPREEEEQGGIPPPRLKGSAPTSSRPRVSPRRFPGRGGRRPRPARGRCR